MTPSGWSAAIPGNLHRDLRDHLLRSDGQEDVCLATYRPSTGDRRRSALIRSVIGPLEDERLVHGTASFTTSYLLRAAREAVDDQCGVVALHSHPFGRGWQGMSPADETTEASYANLVRQITSLPLIGMTIAGNDQWSARAWDRGAGRSVGASPCESVRVLHHDRLAVTWNDELRPRPRLQPTQVRTAHSWGDAIQSDIARLRVLVVGAGSVGLTVAVALAATGIEHIGVIDFDTVKNVNLDRLLGARPLDAYLARSKAQIGRRLVGEAATAEQNRHDAWELSICEPAGFSHLLDFDVIFSCVDRPWPRFVLNTVAYSDLIPVIDGGIHVDPLQGGGMRGAIWRSHVVGHGRACLACNGQYHPSHIELERDGSLDNPSYIAGLAEDHPLRVRQNVSIFSVNCAGSLLSQFVSLVVAPGGLGDPGAIRYQLAPHLLQRDPAITCIDGCPFPLSAAAGDLRVDPTARHLAAEEERVARVRISKKTRVRVARTTDDALAAVRDRLDRRARRELSSTSSNTIAGSPV